MRALAGRGARALRSAKKMNTMRHFITFFSILAVAVSARAEGPPTHTPCAPLFKAVEAARLADEYVAKTFSEFPDIYCSELSYESQQMKPDKTIIWRLRYLIPNNPRREVERSPFPDWGVCLVYVHEDKSVTHTTQPKRNPTAEQTGTGQPAARPLDEPEGSDKPQPEAEGRSR